MPKTITLSDEHLNEFKNILVEVHNASVDEENGDSVHICDYYHHDSIMELAKALGVYDENEEDEYGGPLWHNSVW